MTAAGWIFAELYFRNKPESYYTFRDEEAQKEDEATPSIDDDKDLPGTFASLMPLVVPIVLILLNTTCGMILPEDSPILSIVSFVGDSNIALAIGAVLSIITLGKRLGGKAIIDIMDKTLKDAGPIVFITAAGGALGQVLKVSGAGDSLAQMVLNTGLPFILIPFVISGLLKVVQGSGHGRSDDGGNALQLPLQPASASTPSLSSWLPVRVPVCAATSTTAISGSTLTAWALI